VNAPTYARLRDSLRALRDLLPIAGNTPHEGGGSAQWRQRLLGNVLPALDFDLPVLLVATCGGGSTGKSTLLNTLAGRSLSAVGFRAGLTRRVLLVGHPDVLSGSEIARGLLGRLPHAPVAWQTPEDTLQPGPPLYATAPGLPRNLLLIDTPDFDTGDGSALLNRSEAEPILRTADVLLYVFTNAVYSNYSNTRFMADVIGGIGGRPTILVYRISREASDEEALSHCLTVAHRLYGLPSQEGRWPEQIVGVYRMHESDAVARQEVAPRLIPLGALTGGRPLTELLSSLDVTSIKRHVFAADLRAIVQGAEKELSEARRRASEDELYRRALQQVMAEHALEALTAFPAREALSLAGRLFEETSPAYVRALRGAGRMVAAPLRAAQAVARRIGEWTRTTESPPRQDLYTTLAQSLLASANGLRNRLMDDTLILRATPADALYRAVRDYRERDSTGLPLVEALGDGVVNLHVRVPQPVRTAEEEMLAQDWDAIAARLQSAVPDLVGLPEGITIELRKRVRAFRQGMAWPQRVREAFFASLTALPPLLGVTYTLLTANPVAGTGLWIHLESLFGLNDLWALVSVPASAGLGAQERKQLEEMIAPVFQIWLEQRANAIVDIYADTVCRPVLKALDTIPRPDDDRFARIEEALSTIKGAQ